jgi:alpha-L-fucosidase 2
MSLFPFLKRHLLRATWLGVAAWSATPFPATASADTPAAPASAASVAAPLQLRYEKPAADWLHALPIGNGRLAGMVFGGTAKERIQFNVDSLWTGGSNPSGDYNSMGEYRNFGNLSLELTLPADAKIENYSRSLDITTGVATTQFTVAGVTYKREVFASKPDDVIVIRQSASQPGKLSGKILLTGTQYERTFAEAEPGDNQSSAIATFHGELSNELKYAAQILVAAENGKTGIVEESGKTHYPPSKKRREKRPNWEVKNITFEKSDALTIRLAAVTNYVLDHTKKFSHGDAEQIVDSQITKSRNKTSYAQLRAAAVADTASFMNRVKYYFGVTADAQRSLPTDSRLAAYKKGAIDPELEVLLAQYGRYLLQASSRPGTLPANLQGIWNDSNDPAWHSDYHANINIQMNFWPAETTNLAECHTSLIDLIKSQVPVWRVATAASPVFRTVEDKPAPVGWAVRTSHNINGGLGWKWDKTANAWYCLHIWEHYAFGGDKNYLRQTAYPLIKETCDFWHALLKKLPDGRLVVPNAWSPEHGPDEDGVSYSQEILWDLFDNAVAAAEALEIAADKERFTAIRDALLVPKVGRWGQLQEWVADRDNPRDQHRHTSHLFGVYPGHQIGYTRSPELAKAAAISLEARGESGDSRREWAWAWRSALWARLYESEKAYQKVRGLLKYNILENLFGNHPPFQLDGNFGIAAGITEMLLQSHDGAAHLLPALPNAWSTGNASGLRARGGFTIDIAWENKQIKTVKIKSAIGGNLRLRLPAGTTPKSCGSALIPANGNANAKPNANPFYRLPATSKVPPKFVEFDLSTIKNGEYELHF